MIYSRLEKKYIVCPVFKLHTATSRTWWHWSVSLSVTLFCHNLRINLRVNLRIDLRVGDL